MTTKIIDGKTYHPGVVYNAKGDLVTNLLISATAQTDFSPGTATITFNSNGTISGWIPGKKWVDNTAGWIGGGNYTITWYSFNLIGDVAISNPAPTGNQLLSSNATFSLQGLQFTNTTAQWGYDIINNAVGTQTPEVVSGTIQLNLGIA